MNPQDLLGSMAAFCTTIAFVPQAVTIHKTRSTRDISLAMFSIFTLGVMLWLVYGLVIERWPIIIANAVTFTLAGYILYMKATEHRR